MKIAFMSSTCPNYTAKDVASACNRYGFQGFEPRIEWGHAHGFEIDAPESQIKENRHVLEDAGVAIPCIASGIKTAIPAGKEREELVDKVKRIVELNRAAGSPYVRVFGGGAKELDEETRVRLSIETLSEAAEAAAGSGVTLLLETHDFFRPGRLVGRVVDAVNRPEVAILWDTMHAFVVGETLEETANYLKLDRVKHTHWRDLNVTHKPDGGYDSMQCHDYGQGNFPLAEATQILENAGFPGFASLEVIFKPDDADHDADAFLKQAGAGMKAVHQA